MRLMGLPARPRLQRLTVAARCFFLSINAACARSTTAAAIDRRGALLLPVDQRSLCPLDHGCSELLRLRHGFRDAGRSAAQAKRGLDANCSGCATDFATRDDRPRRPSVGWMRTAPAAPRISTTGPSAPGSWKPRRRTFPSVLREPRLLVRLRRAAGSHGDEHSPRFCANPDYWSVCAGSTAVKAMAPTPHTGEASQSEDRRDARRR